ncbi:MAG: hypothetical protein ACYCXW_05280 [Solirubrobacteraceae bacterium]
MRRPLTLIAAAVAVAVLVVGHAGAHALAGRSRPVSRLLVDAQEWSMWPSRSSIPAGTVIVELWNRGQDPHDLRIRRLNAAGLMVGRVLGAIGVTLPGHIRQATWRLSSGSYELYCSLPGHLELGMHARVRVTRS